MIEEFEVVVPLVVKVHLDGDRVVPVSAAIDKGWPGFFSDSEKAGGVWSEEAQEWGHEEQEAISAAAWQWVRARMRGEQP